MRLLAAALLLLILSPACAVPSNPLPRSSPQEAPEFRTPTPSASPATPSPTPPTETPSSTPIPTVQRQLATVAVDLLSCRYGPGPSYLFLYALRGGANITLIGRTDRDNWHWVYVDGANKCWINATYTQVHGDIRSLPVVYPGLARLPVSPHYPPTAVLRAVRRGSEVTVEWTNIPLRAGDEEDERMQHYIVEVWRCEGGRILFEPLATNETQITLVDEPGCDEPSHGRIFVQEKHGFAGPTEIAWPMPN